MSQIIGGIQLFTFFANVVLGVLVLAKNPRSSVNRSFAFFALSTSGWIITLYLMIFARYGDTLFVGRLAFLFFSIMLASVLWFTSVFPERGTRTRLAHIVSLILGIGFAVLSMSPFMIHSAEIRQTGEFGYIFGTFGPSYLAWLAFYFFTLFYTFFRAWRGMVRSHGLAHRQYRLLVIGMTLLYVTMLTTQIVLPFLGDFRWNSLGPIFTFFLVVFVGQSMLSYRIFDVKWILKWGLIVPVLVSIVVGLMAFLTFLLSSIISPQYSYLIAALFLALSYRPLSRIIEYAASKLISRGSYLFDDAVLQVSHLVERYLSLPEFEQAFQAQLRTFFQFSKQGIIVFAPNKTEIISSALEGFPDRIVGQVPTFLELLRSQQADIIETDELVWRVTHLADPMTTSRDEQTLSLLREWKIAALVPLSIKDSPVGLLILGEKRTGESLTSEDHRLLEVIRGAVSPALANAARFVEMKKLYDRLLELDQAKSDFINVVSHQFRTPLTAIRWHVELLLARAKVAASLRRSLTTIEERSVFLSGMLDRIFDVLALESETLSFESKPVRLDSLAATALEGYERLANEKHIRIETELGTVTALGDESRLSVVLQALIDNALTYTPNGGKIVVETGIVREGKSWALFRVRDSGIGIPPSDLQHVFEKFYRGKSATQTAPDGAGIGLFVVQQFVQRMKGTVEVQSRVHHGSVFTVRLPLAVGR